MCMHVFFTLYTTTASVRARYFLSLMDLFDVPSENGFSAEPFEARVAVTFLGEYCGASYE
jgi:hypothetical protein